MKAEEIIELFRQFESIANEYEGVECWSANKRLAPTPGRNLMIIFPAWGK